MQNFCNIIFSWVAYGGAVLPTIVNRKEEITAYAKMGSVKYDRALILKKADPVYGKIA